MPNEYKLHFYGPGRNGGYKEFQKFISPAPFMTIQQGDIVRAQAWQGLFNVETNKQLRVKHGFVKQTVLVFLEAEGWATYPEDPVE
jgi:hypothetical protein